MDELNYNGPSVLHVGGKVYKISLCHHPRWNISLEKINIEGLRVVDVAFGQQNKVNKAWGSSWPVSFKGAKSESIKIK